MECRAPKVETGEGFEYVRASKPKPLPEQPLTGSAVLGSDEHLALLNDWIVEKQSKHGWDAIRVYVEAQKAGWHLEAFGDRLEDDVKQALIERGLLGAGVDTAQARQHSGGSGTAVPLADSSMAEAPSVSLDDIIDTIKNLQEDSK